LAFALPVPRNMTFYTHTTVSAGNFSQFNGHFFQWTFFPEGAILNEILTIFLSRIFMNIFFIGKIVHWEKCPL